MIAFILVLRFLFYVIGSTSRRLQQSIKTQKTGSTQNEDRTNQEKYLKDPYAQNIQTIINSNERGSPVGSK